MTINVIATAITNWVTANFQAIGNYATGTGTADGTNTGDNATNTQYSGLAASKANKTVQVTSQTLIAANWSLVSGIYEYNLANAGITALNFVEVIPNNTTISITKAADLMPTNVSSAGSVKLYATNLPTGNIVVTINIYE